MNQVFKVLSITIVLFGINRTLVGLQPASTFLQFN